jgi:hypothetical protein
MLPNAVDIVVQRADAEAEAGPQIERMSPAEMFAAYHEATYSAPPREELMALFNRLHEEVTSAPD